MICHSFSWSEYEYTGAVTRTELSQLFISFLAISVFYNVIGLLQLCKTIFLLAFVVYMW